MKSKIPPQDIECEKVIIGSLMTFIDAFSELSHIIDEDCFTDNFHRSIFIAIKAINYRSEISDPMSVKNELDKTGNVLYSSLIDICNYSPATNVTLCQYALLLKEKAIRRKLIQIAYNLENSAYDELIDIHEVVTNTNDSIADVFKNSSSSIITITDAINQVFDTIEKNSSADCKLTGSPTGFQKFDRRTGGLQPSDLIIIGAETSQGKTSLALSITNNVAKYGHNVGIYSMEMSNKQLAARLMASESDIPANEILYSSFDVDKYTKLEGSILSLCNSGIYMDERSTSNIDNIISSIRHLVLKYNIQGAVIDYIQILNINMKGGNTESKMAEVARRLKNLAKELNIWIIALSQLRRDNIKPEPTISRLRSSGQIEEAADQIWLIYRPEVYEKFYPDPFQTTPTHGTALINIAKGRNSGTMMFIAGFKQSTTKFYDISELELMNIPSYVTEHDDEPF